MRARALFVPRRRDVPAAAGQRESGQFPQPAVEGVFRAEPGQFGDEPGVASQPQVELDAFQQHRQPQFRQSFAVDPGVRAGEPRERSSPPQAERPGQQTGRLAGLLRGGARAGRGDQLVEHLQVQSPGGDVQEVTLAVGLDPGSERAPEPVDVRSDRARRRARQLLSPEAVDDLVEVHDVVAPQEEHREQRPLLRRSEGKLFLAPPHLDRSEHGEERFGLSARHGGLPSCDGVSVRPRSPGGGWWSGPVRSGSLRRSCARRHLR